MYQLDIFEIFSISREQVLKIIEVSKKLSNVITKISRLFCSQVKNEEAKKSKTWRLLKALRLKYDVNSLIILAWRS